MMGASAISLLVSASCLIVLASFLSIPVVNGAQLLFTTFALGFNRFEFVLLEAAVGGTEISFTDQGFITSSETLRTGTTSSEGVLTWTAPFPKLDPGITVLIDFLGTPTATIGSVVSSLNTMDFSTEMDQVIAFTEDDFGVKTFIAAVTSQRASSALFTDATDDFTTGLPTGLVVGESAVAFASSTSIAALKNFHFNLPQNLFPGGDVATMRAVLCDPGNWFRNNSNDIYGLNFIMPTQSPTVSPSTSPTVTPTASPTLSPTVTPTISPTIPPTQNPTHSPSISPTDGPTSSPTISPTFGPTVSPTPPTFTPTTSPTVFILGGPGSLSDTTIIGISVGGGAVGLIGFVFIGWFFLYKPAGVKKVVEKAEDEAPDKMDALGVGDTKLEKGEAKHSL